jgi:gliding motility-associated transport system ATP-binding protein
MIEVRNLTKWYGRVLAVDDVSFSVRKGTVVGFLGPNGAGKSTTLKIITCYLPATSGSVEVDGCSVLSDSLEVRSKMGYMPEAVPLYPEMRVGELLRFWAALRDIPPRQRNAAVERAGERCWLSKPENMMRRRVGTLSRGYKQRVGLAGALLHNPAVLVLDEPTIGLDPTQIREMRRLITELGQDRTVILSSHILAEVEQTCSDLIVIAGGRIAAAGSPDELRRRVTGPARLLVELRGADAKDLSQAVQALSGVRKVESEATGNWTRLAVEADERDDHRAEVFRLVRDRGWELRELRREAGSLEDFFVQITYEQNMRAAERKARSQSA